MNTQLKKTATAAIVALALGAGIVATSHASNDGDFRNGDDASSIERSGRDDAGQLPVEAIVSRLRGAGYSDLRKVEREHGRYEVKGRNADGQRVELEVDARSGEILKQRQDD